MKRLRTIGAAVGLLVFGVLVVELVWSDDAGHTSGRAVDSAEYDAPTAADSTQQRARASGHTAVDRTALERLRSRFSAADAARLGDRLGPGSEVLAGDGSGDPTAPRAMVPTAGEGAESSGWDEMSPEQRMSKARREVEAALAEADRASSEEDREQWRSRASWALGSVRADFYGAGDEEGYAELETRIEE